MFHKSVPQHQAERVIAKDTFQGRDYYLVQWVGLSRQDATWEPVEKLGAIKQMLKRFEKYGSQREIVEIPSINNKVLTDSSSEQSSHSSPAVQITLSSSSQSSSKDDSLPIPFSSAGKSVPNHHSSIIQKIDQMLQPYQDEFITLFSNLRKRIRLDLEGNFSDVPTSRPKRNAITQTDMSTLKSSQDNIQVSKNTKERNNSALIDKELINKIKPSKQGSSIKKDQPNKNPKSDNKDSKSTQPKEIRKSRENKDQKKKDVFETNYLGSFDRGNEIEFIIKGMKCSNDGSRKYLVRWKQVEGHQVRDSWVDEDIMKDYACKDLARFFLSRINWSKS